MHSERGSRRWAERGHRVANDISGGFTPEG